MVYMLTFTINIPQMLAYIPYMDPMGHDHTKMDEEKPYGFTRNSTYSRVAAWPNPTWGRVSRDIDHALRLRHGVPGTVDHGWLGGTSMGNLNIFQLVNIQNKHRNSWTYPLKMLVFHSYVNVYQRVPAGNWTWVWKMVHVVRWLTY